MWCGTEDFLYQEQRGTCGIICANWRYSLDLISEEPPGDHQLEILGS